MSLSFLVRQSSGLSWPIYLLIPSGNQTWQLKIHPYSYRYCPIKASIYRGCSIATSDYWKVYVLVCIHFASACLCVHECGWIWGVWCIAHLLNTLLHFFFICVSSVSDFLSTLLNMHHRLASVSGDYGEQEADPTGKLLWNPIAGFYYPRAMTK